MFSASASAAAAAGTMQFLNSQCFVYINQLAQTQVDRGILRYIDYAGTSFLLLPFPPSTCQAALGASGPLWQGSPALPPRWLQCWLR